MTREVVAIAGDDVGHEVVPLALACLLAVLPETQVIKAEAGSEHAWRTGRAIDPETLEVARAVGAVLLGPLRASEGAGSPVLDALTTTLDLYATLYPLPPRDQAEPLLVVEHLPPGVGAARDTLPPARAWAATRLGNAAGELLHQRGARRLALVHDSEREWAHAVMGGMAPFAGQGVEVERLDAIFLLNHFETLVGEFDLLLTSVPTGELLVTHTVRSQHLLSQRGRLLIGVHGIVATPLHGSMQHRRGWGFVNPLGAIRAVVALLRYGWREVEATQRLEAAIARVTPHVRTPDQGGTHSTQAVADAILEALPPAP